jgi:catechol 2,3-dioxygenase-like lactoylglutathione lyase family enzyme
MRKAAAGDAEFLQALFERRHVRGSLHPPNSFEFTRGEHLLVERDREPFGYLALSLEEDWLLGIRALAVWEPQCGAGRFALEFAKRRAFDEPGVHRIFLEVLESNAPMRRLCERAGFRLEGIYRDGYCDESGAFHRLIPYGMLRDDVAPLDAASSKPSIVGIDHVQIAMPAGGEALARDFYAGAVGFREEPKPVHLANRGGVWFRSGDAAVHLGIDRDFRAAAKAHPAFRCSGYDELVARLQTLDIPVVSDERAFEGKRHCYLTDPFGNRIELIER